MPGLIFFVGFEMRSHCVAQACLKLPASSSLLSSVSRSARITGTSHRAQFSLSKNSHRGGGWIKAVSAPGVTGLQSLKSLIGPGAMRRGSGFAFNKENAG